MRFKKLLLYFLLIILTSAAFILLDEYVLDIREGNLIYSPLDLSKPLDLSPPQPLPSDIGPILNQTFSYMSEGGQSYVFLSQDKKYVLKLFKYKRFRPAWYFKFLPNTLNLKKFKDTSTLERFQKLQRVLKGHEVAYNHIKEGSALLFVQLSPPFNVERFIQLKDKLGRSFPLDLNKTSYILQKKGEMLRIIFHQLMEKKDINGIKGKLSQIFRMYMKEYSQGIHDCDHGIMQNLGFIDEEPFHLDVGKLEKNANFKNPEFYEKDLIAVSKRMTGWFKKYYPFHYEEIQLHLEKDLSLLFQRQVAL